MAYDEELADRIRALLDDHDPSERKMFGGVGFMVDGKMAIAASSNGGVMVRVNPADSDALCGEEGVERMEMRGRRLDGWLSISPECLEEDATLTGWIARGIAAASAAG